MSCFSDSFSNLLYFFGRISAFYQSWVKLWLVKIKVSSNFDFSKSKFHQSLIKLWFLKVWVLSKFDMAILFFLLVWRQTGGWNRRGCIWWSQKPFWWKRRRMGHTRQPWKYFGQKPNVSISAESALWFCLLVNFFCKTFAQYVCQARANILPMWKGISWPNYHALCTLPLWQSYLSRLVSKKKSQLLNAWMCPCYRLTMLFRKYGSQGRLVGQYVKVQRL